MEMNWRGGPSSPQVLGHTLTNPTHFLLGNMKVLVECSTAGVEVKRTCICSLLPEVPIPVAVAVTITVTASPDRSRSCWRADTACTRNPAREGQDAQMCILAGAQLLGAAVPVGEAARMTPALPRCPENQLDCAEGLGLADRGQASWEQVGRHAAPTRASPVDLGADRSLHLGVASGPHAALLACPTRLPLHSMPRGVLLCRILLPARGQQLAQPHCLLMGIRVLMDTPSRSACALPQRGLLERTLLPGKGLSRVSLQAEGGRL